MEDLAQTRIGELVARHPATSRVFRRHSIDFCCGGGRTIAAACAARGLDQERVVEELRCAVEHAHGDPATEDAPDWLTEDLSSLVRFIVERYHVPLREELERLRQMSEKVVSVHGERAPDVWPPLAKVFDRFRRSLLDHMECEEDVLFPLVERLAARAAEPASTAPNSSQLGSPPGPPLGSPIESMEGDHDRAGDDLRRMRELTHDFVPPADACNTVRALLDGLEHLEEEMHQHVHLENEILFPRALDLERRLAGGRQTL